MKIPNLYHFIWIGTHKPYFLLVAIQSVLLRCKGSEVILWVDEDTDPSVELDRLKRNDRFSTRKIDFEDLAARLTPEINKIVTDIFEIAGSKSNLTNTRPIERSRSNLLRYMILYVYGGVYLDADTLVLKDLAPLNTASTGYFGRENSVWPIVKRNNPLHRFLWAPFLEVFRFVAVQLSFGYRLNTTYRMLCSSSENNAVLGFTKGHNYLLACFRHISNMPKAEILRPLRLGPFLLQWVSGKYKGDDFMCYPEAYFYPYGPLISQHFFRERKKVNSVADYMISDTTYVLHWGASTKYLKQYTRDELLKSPPHSVFAYLANQVINDYEQTYGQTHD